MKKYIRVIVEFILIMLLSLLVFVVFSHMRPILNRDVDLVARSFVVVALLVSSLLMSRSGRFKKYRQIVFAFFIAIFAISVDYYLPSSRWLLSILNIPIQTPTGLTLDKLDSRIIIMGLIVLFTKLSGGNLTSIYLNKGNIKKVFLLGL